MPTRRQVHVGVPLRGRRASTRCDRGKPAVAEVLPADVVKRLGAPVRSHAIDLHDDESPTPRGLLSCRATTRKATCGTWWRVGAGVDLLRGWGRTLLRVERGRGLEEQAPDVGLCRHDPSRRNGSGGVPARRSGQSASPVALVERRRSRLAIRSMRRSSRDRRQVDARVACRRYVVAVRRELLERHAYRRPSVSTAHRSSSVEARPGRRCTW